MKQFLKKIDFIQFIIIDNTLSLRNLTNKMVPSESGWIKE